MQSSLMMHGRSGGYLGLDPAANSFHRIGDYFILYSVGIIALQHKKNYTEICQQNKTILVLKCWPYSKGFFKVFDKFIMCPTIGEKVWNNTF